MVPPYPILEGFLSIRGPYWVIFVVEARFNYLHYNSILSDFYSLSYFRVLAFWWTILGDIVLLKNYSWFSSCSYITIIFYVSFNPDIYFYLKFWGCFCTFGALLGHFGMGVGFKNCFWCLLCWKKVTFSDSNYRLLFNVGYLANGVYSGQKSFFIPPTHFSWPANPSLKISLFFAKFATILEIWGQNRENLDI